MAIAITLAEYLRNWDLDFEVLPHPRTWSSMQTAEAAHVPGDRVAKSVLLKDEQGYLLAALPASHRLDLGTLHRRYRRDLGLATEAEIATLMADCALGAVPPTGPAYGIETIVDESLMEQPDVYFEAGDHEDLIHMRRDQFRSLMTGCESSRFSHHL